jgi:hypothetical protein
MTNESYTAEFEETRRQLDAMRRKHGDDTPIGHACSNIIQLIDAIRKEPDRHAQRRQAEEIARQGVTLAVLISASIQS